MASSIDRKTKTISEKGQIIVEYVLLLITGIAIAAAITSFLVSRNEDNPGILILKWQEIIQTIGADPADEVINP